MALFGPGKEKIAAAENTVMQILANHEYLDNLVNAVLIKSGRKPVDVDEEGNPLFLTDNEWLTKCQSYYDSRIRTIAVESDCFEIKWSTSHMEQYQTANGAIGTREVEDIIERIGYAYTKDGYMPLHGVNVGEVTVNLNRVLDLWMQVIKERLQAEFPDLEFDPYVRVNGDSAYVTYRVPALTWKSWF